MSSSQYYNQLAAKRRARVRAAISGTAARPRLTVFRSNKHTYLQVIDDQAGTTLASANTKQLKKTSAKMADAQATAEALLAQLDKKGIKALVFDRGSYRYHGRVKLIAEVLREGKIEV